MTTVLRAIALGAALIPLSCAVSFSDDDSPEATDPPGAEATDTPAPTAPPTPEATAAPTAAPTPTAWPLTGYRVSALFFNADEGMDLDDDGDADNDFIEVYSASVQVIADQVFSAAYATLSSNLPIEQARLIAIQLREAVVAYYAVDNLNTLIRRSISVEALNLAQLVDEGGSADVMEWYEAEALGDGVYRTQRVVGRLAGSLNAGGGLFGPGPLTLDLTDVFGTPGEGSALTLDGEVELDLDGAWASFSNDDGGFSDGRLAGVLWREDLHAFMLALVPTAVCSPNGATCVPFEITDSTSAALDEAYDELEASFAIQEGSRAGVAVSLTFFSDHVPVTSAP